MKSAGVWLAAVLFCMGGGADRGLAASLAASAPVTILGTAEMKQDGLLFPDMPLSFLRAGDRYIAFAAAGSVADIGPGPAIVPFGTYRFVGTLDHLAPDRQGRSWPVHALTKGRAQPSPDGADFDRDYGGGGQVVPLDGGSVLLELYHGEFHCAPPTGLPAIGGMGMAVSQDGGDSFRKIGEILAPTVSQQAFCDSGRKGGLWSDGGMIEADENGRWAEGSSGYDYILFVDHGALGEPFAGLSIARARTTDVLGAIRAGRAPTFTKYYNPDHAPGPKSQFFTEPGIGGRSTPILAARGVFIGTPMIYYDNYKKLFVLSYQYNQQHIAIATSDNLFEWTSSANVYDAPAGDSARVFYPSLVGTGPDPAVLGQTFHVFFLKRTPPNINPQLERITVTVR